MLDFYSCEDWALSSGMIASTLVWLLEYKISSISPLLIPIPKVARNPRKTARSILRIMGLSAINLRIGHKRHISTGFVCDCARNGKA